MMDEAIGMVSDSIVVTDAVATAEAADDQSPRVALRRIHDKLEAWKQTEIGDAVEEVCESVEIAAAALEGR